MTMFPCEIWAMGRRQLPSLQRMGRAAVAAAAVRPATHLPQARTTLGKHLAAARPRALEVPPRAPCLGGKRQWGGLHRGQRGAPLFPNPCRRCQRLGQESTPHSHLLGFALGHGAMLGTAVQPPGETKPEGVSQEGAQCIAASRHGGRLEMDGVGGEKTPPNCRSC